MTGTLAGWLACTSPPPPLPPPPLPRPPVAAVGAAHGKTLYLRHCAGCHGPEGAGDGAAAPYLFPKPRNFGLAKFRIVSGRVGDLPTERDLFQILTKGMPSSAMPSWEFLPEGDRWALVRHVKTLVKTYDEENERWVNLYEIRGEPSPIAVGAAPPPTAARVANGKALYRAKGDCIKCHGETGKGDGPSSAQQKEEGFPVLPRDLNEGVFKGGSRPEDLFRRISFGIGPMPGNETMTQDERWDLVHYVLSIAKPGAQQKAEQKRRILASRRVRGEIPHDPAHGFWTRTGETPLPLMPLWWRKERVDEVSVSSAHNGTEIAIRLAWADPTRSDCAIRPQDFRDGASIQFANSENPPFLGMGLTEPWDPVNLWFWRSDREGKPEEFPTVQSTYPNMAVDDYPCLKNWKPGEGFSAKDKAVTSHVPLFLPGWGTGNLISAPDKGSPVESLCAAGPSTLASMDRASQIIHGRGTWERGRWEVVLWRNFAVEDPEDIVLAPGKRVPVSFAIWDGAHKDRDGQKAITLWHTLEVE